MSAFPVMNATDSPSGDTAGFEGLLVPGTGVGSNSDRPPRPERGGFPHLRQSPHRRSGSRPGPWRHLCRWLPREQLILLERDTEPYHFFWGGLGFESGQEKEESHDGQNCREACPSDSHSVPPPGTYRILNPMPERLVLQRRCQLRRRLEPVGRKPLQRLQDGSLPHWPGSCA